METGGRGLLGRCVTEGVAEESGHAIGSVTTQSQLTVATVVKGTEMRWLNVIRNRVLVS